MWSAAEYLLSTGSTKVPSFVYKELETRDAWICRQEGWGGENTSTCFLLWTKTFLSPLTKDGSEATWQTELSEVPWLEMLACFC